MSTFSSFAPSDIRASATTLTQLVDVSGADISGSDGRKTYSHFVSGSLTSSLYWTFHDQDYTLSTANPICDMTFGFFSGSSHLQSSLLSVDSAGKSIWSSQSFQIREKINIYRSLSQVLLGDADAQFVAPFGSATAADAIDAAVFLSYKRLFVRDGMKRETFAMRLFSTATLDVVDNGTFPNFSNIFRETTSGSDTLTDIGSSTSRETALGGAVGNIVMSSNTSNTVGLIFYDAGIVVLDAERVFWGGQHASGTIGAAYSAGGTSVTNGAEFPAGSIIMGRTGYGNPSATYIPDFFVSASIDDINKHMSTVRFGGASATNSITSAMTFQNMTNINSTLVFCRADADSFNLSSNPTYTNADGQIIINEVDETATPFTFVTSVGLYDANNNLLAVAKLSRPLEKNFTKAMNIRVRLDF
jgi:hypothetical protein